jgi:adenylate cyclase
MQKEAVLEGEKRELSIFFSDVADFTAISERLSPEELVQRLGVYFDGLSRTVLGNAGTLDKYVGDAIVAFWGAPQRREDHPRLACVTALECQRFLDRNGPQWEAEGHPAFRTRIGIHTGEVIVGNIGYEERMNYTIIGDAANLASRLEGLNKFYGTRIIISEDVYGRVKEEFVARKLDRVAVKGRSRGVLIYELIAARGEVVGAQEAFQRAYDEAMELYLGRSWAEARRAFADAAGLAPRGKDRPCELLGARCEEFLREPPAPDWNGVYVHHAK